MSRLDLKLKSDNRELSQFTLKVLKTVSRVPAGKVVTYATLAKAIGSPKASRAVGNALHVNPWAPKVPCHRVIKSDFTLGGYGLGQKKKLKILAAEGINFDKNLRIKDYKKILKTI